MNLPVLTILISQNTFVSFLVYYKCMKINCTFSKPDCKIYREEFKRKECVYNVYNTVSDKIESVLNKNF